MVVSVAPGNYVVQAAMPDATGPLQLTCPWSETSTATTR